MKNKRPIIKIGSLLLFLCIFGSVLLFSLPEVNNIKGRILEDEIVDDSDKFSSDLKNSGLEFSQQLIFGTNSGPVNLDPHYAWESSSVDVIDQVVETLYAYNLSEPELVPIPRLASGFGTWSQDWLNYTVPLRTDVTFHDGTQFNASTVKWNFDRLAYFMNIDGSLPLGTSTTLFSTLYLWPDGTPIIDRVEIVDDYTVKFVLTKPFTPLEALLSFSGSGIMSPAVTPPLNYIDTATGDLVGTGPFVYDNYEVDVEVTMSAYENYWSGAPNIDKLTFSIIPNSYERNQALLDGNVDFIKTPDNSFLQEFRDDPDITLVDAGQEATFWYLGMNNRIINVSFREAISYAIDYTYIIDEFLGGEAVRLKSPIPLGIRNANWSFNVPILNLTRARQIMQSMGFGVEFDVSNDADWEAASFISFNYTYNIGNTLRENLLGLLQDNLGKIGITVIDDGVTTVELFNRYSETGGRTRDQLELYFLGWGPDYNDPSNFINPLFTNRSVAFNGAQYNGFLAAIEDGRDPYALNDNVQLLMEAAIAETDPVQREKYYNRIQELLIERDFPWAWGYVRRNYDVYSTEFTGFQSNPLDKVWFYPVVHLDDFGMHIYTAVADGFEDLDIRNHLTTQSPDTDDMDIPWFGADDGIPPGIVLDNEINSHNSYVMKLKPTHYDQPFVGTTYSQVKWNYWYLFRSESPKFEIRPGLFDNVGDEDAGSHIKLGSSIGDTIHLSFKYRNNKTIESFLRFGLFYSNYTKSLYDNVNSYRYNDDEGYLVSLPMVDTIGSITGTGELSKRIHDTGSLFDGISILKSDNSVETIHDKFTHSIELVLKRKTVGYDGTISISVIIDDVEQLKGEDNDNVYYIFDEIVVGVENPDAEPLFDNVKLYSVSKYQSVLPNSRIVYVSGSNIYSSDLDGGNKSRLTYGGAPFNDPVWSPNGLKIAYTSSGIIYIANADGSNPKILTTNFPYGWQRDPEWSWDGTKIVFAAKSHKNAVEDMELFIADVDGTQIVQVTDNKADDWDPTLSPDGTKIIFTSRGRGEEYYWWGDSDIWIANSDGTNEFCLTQEELPHYGGWSDAYPSWSPDGSKIVFSSTRDAKMVVNSNFYDETWGIYTMNPDGSNVIRLVFNETQPEYWFSRPDVIPDDSLKPRFTRDGNSIFFYRGRYYDSYGYSGIYIMNSDGTNEHQLRAGLSSADLYFSDYVQMVNRPPFPLVEVSNEACSGFSLLFDASDTHDPEENQLQYRWDFETDGIWDTDWLTSPYVVNTWNNEWSGFARLEVSDGELSSNLYTEIRVMDNPSIEDTDSDKLSDFAESNIIGTDPLKADTDGDNILDGDELIMYHTNPLDIDSDDDSLDDCEEITLGIDGFITNPNDRDTDGDGLTDDEKFIHGTNPTSSDTDSDGMPDQYEIENGLNPIIDDSTGDLDSDGLNNYNEYLIGTDQHNPDSDGDMITDGEEVVEGADGYISDPLDRDTDNDYLDDLEEVTIGFDGYITDPSNSDTDADGLSDLLEYIHYTDPTDRDSDDDYLPDGIEVKLYKTDPLNPDTDGDGLTDGFEAWLGSDPTDKDSDNDGMPDGWEFDNNLLPMWDDATRDRDSDGLLNLDEFLTGTFANNPDTDGDGLSDGNEVNTLLTDPLLLDTDGDGLEDGYEVLSIGSDPLDFMDPVNLPIIIDGDATGVGAHNWTWALNFKICTGSGTYSDPYNIKDFNIDGWSSGSCIEINNSDVYFKIENCTLYNSTVGIKLYNVENGAIYNNSIYDNTLQGIYHSYSRRNTIAENFIHTNGDRGIYITGPTPALSSHGNSIVNNTIYDNIYGITLYPQAQYNTISGNIIFSNTQDGIQIASGSSYNEISDNKIYNNNRHGIQVYAKCYYNIISENHIHDNSRVGILLSYLVADNILSNNNLSANNNGISFTGSGVINNNLTHNNISNNIQYGVYCDPDATNNKFNWNNFIGNAINAMDEGNNNQWDDGAIGNYWDDYTGADLNDDGIGDNPYDISGSAGSQDNYPILDDGPDFDSDGDGLVDRMEDILGTNPLDPDTDDDGLTDGDEVLNLYSDPLNYMDPVNLPIFIDGSATGVGAHNWTWAVTYKVCTGSGTYSYPYVIEGFEINAGGSGSGITIRNSDVYFIIKNCKVYNASSEHQDAGIKLEHVNNGLLINNNASNNKRCGIYLNDSSNNTISGNTANNNDYGIYLYYNCYYNTITGNTVNNNNYSGIYLYNFCNDNTITGNTANYNHYSGISLVSSCNDNTITGNMVNNNDYGILLNAWCRYNTITGNTASNIGTLNQAIGIYLEDHCNLNTISGNTVNNNNYYGIYLYNFCNDNTITGNTVNNNNDYGIYLYNRCNDNTITGNTVNNNGAVGIYLEISCDNNTITGNTANNNHYHGIHLESVCDLNTISGNTANYNHYSGIYLSFFCSNNTITGNTANNNVIGIYLYYSHNNIIFRNDLSNYVENIHEEGCWNVFQENIIQGAQIGINLDNSTGNEIDSNTFINNGIGIMIRNSTDNIVLYNNFTDNDDYAIMVTENSSNNEIYYNEFIDNNNGGVQAYDDSGENFWTDDQGIGNYWNDFLQRYPDSERDDTMWIGDYELDGLIGVTDGGSQVFSPSGIDKFLTTINDLIDFIQNLPDECWENAENKNAMIDKLLEIKFDVSTGNLEEAYDKLLHDIKPKLTALKADENDEIWGNGVFNQSWIVIEEMFEMFTLVCNDLLSQINTLITNI